MSYCSLAALGYFDLKLVLLFWWGVARSMVYYRELSCRMRGVGEYRFCGRRRSKLGLPFPMRISQVPELHPDGPLESH